MAGTSVADIFGEFLTSLSEVRTAQVSTFIGAILTTFGTIFLNTILKLLIIAGVKLAVTALLSHHKHEKMLDIRRPLINIEDASIHYSSPAEDYLPTYEEYGGGYQYGPAEEDTEEDEPVYVFREGRKRTS